MSLRIWSISASSGFFALFFSSMSQYRASSSGDCTLRQNIWPIVTHTHTTNGIERQRRRQSRV
jgi:hypothetical protein